MVCMNMGVEIGDRAPTLNKNPDARVLGGLKQVVARHPGSARVGARSEAIRRPSSCSWPGFARTTPIAMSASLLMGPVVS